MPADINRYRKTLKLYGVYDYSPTDEDFLPLFPSLFSQVLTLFHFDPQAKAVQMARRIKACNAD